MNARTHGTATRRATLLLDAEAEETLQCATCGELSTASFAGARDWTWVRPAIGRVFQPCCPGCKPKKVP